MPPASDAICDTEGWGQIDSSTYILLYHAMECYLWWAIGLPLGALRCYGCYMPCWTTSGPRIRVRLGWVRFGVRGLNGLGFSEWVAVPTCLSCLGFSCGWRACHEEWRRDKRWGKRATITGETIVSRIYSTSLLILLWHSVLQYFLLYIEQKLYGPLWVP